MKWKEIYTTQCLLEEICSPTQDSFQVKLFLILSLGGGAFEMEVSNRLLEKSKTVEGLLQLPYQAVALALEVIPRTLANNCGADVVRVITELRSKHTDKTDPNSMYYGINGNTGKIENVKDLGIWDTINVRKQTLKTSVESACMILRIDDIVSGIKKNKQIPQGKAQAEPAEGAETVNKTIKLL